MAVQGQPPSAYSSGACFIRQLYSNQERSAEIYSRLRIGEYPFNWWPVTTEFPNTLSETIQMELELNLYLDRSKKLWSYEKLMIDCMFTKL